MVVSLFSNYIQTELFWAYSKLSLGLYAFCVEVSETPEPKATINERCPEPPLCRKKDGQLAAYGHLVEHSLKEEVVAGMKDNCGPEASRAQNKHARND